MDIISQFEAIYKDRDEEGIIPFFRGLSPAERKEILKEVRLIRKIEEKRDRFDDNYDVLKELYDDHIYRHCNFFCLGKDDLDKVEFIWRDLPEFEDMERLLADGIPEDFPVLFARVLVNRHSRMGYEDATRWIRNGYIDKEESKPFLARWLFAVFPHDAQTGDPARYIEARLEEYPEILTEQIWYLLRYPHEAFAADRRDNLKVGKLGPWTYLFKRYSENGKIDREKLLKELIAGLFRDFKRDQRNWITGLFEAMEPGRDELLFFQDELLELLSSTLPKQVNMSLGFIKKIALDESFKKEAFLQAVPALLASETKPILTGTLGLLELLAKSEKSLQEEICTLAAAAFFAKDESVQKRAAKLIAKYGSPDSKDLQNALLPYAESVLMAVRPQLAVFLKGEGKQKEAVLQQPSVEREVAEPLHIRDEKRIPYIEDVDELIFRCSKILHHFTMADFYLVPEAMLRLRENITEAVLDKFAPVIKNAYKFISRYDPYPVVPHELTAHFILDFCKIRFEQEPDTGKFGKTRNSSLDLIGWSERRRSERETNFSEPAFLGFQKLLDEFLEKAKTADPLPPVSTPSHDPTWLDPETLIARLAQYQRAGKEPGLMDMQQAIQLCSLQFPEKILPLVKKKLTGELCDLFTWFFDVSEPLPKNRLHPEWWLTCAMIQTARPFPAELARGFDAIPLNTLSGSFTAQPYVEVVTDHVHNFKTGEDEPVTRRDSRLRLDMTELYAQDTMGLSLFAGHTFCWSNARLVNTSYLMLSVPNNWQTLLACLIKWLVRYHISGADKSFVPILQVYQGAEVPLRDLDYTLFALCMISPDKILRSFSGETWAMLTSLGLIDNSELGKTLGEFEKIEFAPLKRLNELVEKTLSGINNLELEKLLSACLTLLPETPITNLKKLLEIYKEVLLQNGSQPASSVLSRLAAWAGEKSLKKLVKEIRKEQA